MKDLLTDWFTTPRRARVAWWVYVLVFAGFFLFVLYSFLGTVILGIFGYYATRPLYDRITRRVGSDGLVATVTVLFVVLPILLLLGYTGFVIFGRLTSIVGGDPGAFQSFLQGVLRTEPLPDQQMQVLRRILQNPAQAVQDHRQTITTLLQSGVGILFNVAKVLLHLSLALALTFYLLRDDDEIAEWFRENVADENSTAYAYALAVDGDLETLYYGNMLFVAFMSVLSAAIYLGANAIAPPGLQIPIPLVLALLTGLSALIPIIVTKIVYVPLVGYLALAATSTPGDQLWFPIALLAVSLVVLDLAPQMVLQPYITGGSEIHMGLMMFAYILGPIMFGWYGFFYLPLLLVAGLQIVRIPFTQLIHGEPLTPTVDAAESVSTELSDHGDHRSPIADESETDGETENDN